MSISVFEWPRENKPHVLRVECLKCGELGILTTWDARSEDASAFPFTEIKCDCGHVSKFSDIIAKAKREFIGVSSVFAKVKRSPTTTECPICTKLAQNAKNV